MQNKYPQKPGIDFILKQAFFYWNKTLIYQLIFSIIYFAIFFTSIAFFGTKYGVLQQNQELMEAFKISTEAYLHKVETLSATGNSRYFTYAFFATIVFLYPLNFGFFQIYRKIDLGEKIILSDLFVGYNGLNFFKYIFYFIFWSFVYLITIQTIILAVVWVAITFFVAPLMFFMDKKFFEAIFLNIKVLRKYFIEIFVCVMVATFFKYLGFALFLVGGLFTFPFWNAIIYSLYKTVFSEKN